MDLIAALSEALSEGANARRISDNIVNIYALSRELTKADVDAARIVLVREGYTEVRSWLASQSVSWLSDGVHSVSFEVL